MARCLPRPLIPVLVGVSAATLGLLVMTPSFAGMTQPGDPAAAPTTRPAPTGTAGPIPSVTAASNPPSSSPSRTRYRSADPTPSAVGSCAACVDIDDVDP